MKAYKLNILQYVTFAVTVWRMSICDAASDGAGNPSVSDTSHCITACKLYEIYHF